MLSGMEAKVVALAKVGLFLYLKEHHVQTKPPLSGVEDVTHSSPSESGPSAAGFSGCVVNLPQPLGSNSFVIGCDPHVLGCFNM